MRISDWSSDVCSSDLYTYQSAWFLRGFDAGVRGTSEPQEARIGTMGGRIIGPCPTGASAAGRSPSEKDKGPARAGAFVRRIASASTRLRRRPAFRALSLKKQGSGQIDSPSTRDRKSTRLNSSH